MSLPGFTADASLYRVNNIYRSIHGVSKSHEYSTIISQFDFSKFFCKLYCTSRFEFCKIGCTQSGPEGRRISLQDRFCPMNCFRRLEDCNKDCERNPPPPPCINPPSCTNMWQCCPNYSCANNKCVPYGSGICPKIPCRKDWKCVEGKCEPPGPIR